MRPHLSYCRAITLYQPSTKLVGENHVRVLHLTGMLAWAEGRPEHAAGYLMQAADAGSEDPNVYLDCAEFLFRLSYTDGSPERSMRRDIDDVFSVA